MRVATIAQPGTNRAHAAAIDKKRRSAWFVCGIGAEGECVEAVGCTSQVRFCLYDPATGHQKPSYFENQFRRWIESYTE